MLMQVNANAGWGRYRLPESCLSLYLAGLVLGPAIGASVLVTTWVRRARFVYVASDAEARIRDRVIVAAMLAILLDAVWVTLLPYVLQAAGASPCP